MNRIDTRGIILARTDYGEADRIINFITPDQGKVAAIAKGVRKSKSKLAGGIELFSVSEISYIIGRSDINTLISSRLIKHYASIVKDLDRTASAYQMLKVLNTATEDRAEEGYFNILLNSLEALDDGRINLGLINVWFDAQLLRQSGHSPNLRNLKTGEKLQAGEKYDFDYDAMAFAKGDAYGTDQIKFLRLLFSENQPSSLQKVNQSAQLAAHCLPLVQTMLRNFVRL